MKTQSIDTDPRVEAVQIALLRQASVTTRIERMRALTRTILQLAQDALARANPTLNEQELNILFVRYHYGDDLADRLQAYLQSRA